MTETEAERFRRLESAFRRVGAVEEGGDRAGVIDREVRRNPDLAAELRALIEHDPGTEGSGRGRQDRLARAESLLDQISDQATGPADGESAAIRRIGPYRLIRELGAGSSGVVHLAVDETSGDEVAIKVLHAFASGPRGFARFRREAAVLTRLDHPGIAAIRDAGAIDTPAGRQGWIAMEYVRGESITRWAAARRADREGMLRLVVRTAEAVGHAHRHGVVHRDLKPANVFVTEHGDPKVLDLGAARLLVPDEPMVHTETGQVIGTVPYMAPEQFDGIPEHVSPACDVYALGVMTYRLLTGRLPLDVAGRPIAEAARIARDEEPSSLGTVDRGLRGSISAVVGTALAKDPSRRYPDADAFAADLQRAIDGEAVVARPPSLLEQLRRVAKRNRRLLGAAAATFVVLVAALVVATTLAVTSERLRRQESADRIDAENRRVEADRLRADVARERDDAVLQAAAANLAGAESAVRAGETGEARRRLARVPDAYRGWTWSHLTSRSDRSSEPAVRPDVEPDGRLAAVAAIGPDRVVAAAHAEPGGLVIIENGAVIDRRPAIGWVNDLVVGRHPGELILGGHNGIEVHDLDAGIVWRPSGGSFNIRSLLVHADGHTLVAGDIRGRVWWIDLETRAVRGSATILDAPGAMFVLPTWVAGETNADAPVLVVGEGDGGRHAWCAPDGEIRTEVLWSEDAYGLGRAATSPDCRLVATMRDEGVVIVRSTEDWSILARWPAGLGDQEPLAVLDDSSILVGSVAGIGWYEMDGTLRGVLPGHDWVVRDLDVVAGTRRVRTVAWDGTMRTWDLDQPDEPLALEHPRAARRAAFAAGGDILVTGGGRHPTPDGRVRAWDSVTGHPLGEFEETLAEINGLLVVPNPAALAGTDAPGELVVAGGIGLMAWSIDGGPPLWRSLAGRGLWSLAVLDSSVLIAATYTGDVYRIDVPTGTPTRIADLDLFGPEVGVLPDGTLFVAGRDADSGTDRRMRLDAASGSVLATLDGGRPHPLDVLVLDRGWPSGSEGDGSPGWLVAVAESGGQVSILDGRTLEVVDVLLSPGSPVRQLAALPRDGDEWRLLVVGDDSLLRLIPRGQRQPLATLVVHDRSATAVAASPDGHTIATGSMDRRARIWHAAPRSVGPAAR